MHTFCQQPNRPQQPASCSISRPSTPAPLDHPHAARAYERARADTQPSDRPANRDGRHATARRDHRFSALRVYPQGSVRLQTRLLVNAPGDVYEHEAEHVADNVVGVPAAQAQGVCACGGACPTCQATHQSQTRRPLSIQRLQANDARHTAAPPIVEQVLRSPGRPLDAATSDFFGPRFGHDFSRVRIHTDAQAATSARRINARAYTAGRAIVFGPGQYQPATHAGRRLLAHELTHVVQQGGADSSTAIQPDRIQRDEVTFRGCAENGHDLDSFRVIPNDQEKPMYTPQDGVEHEDVDGFLWRPVRQDWYKIPYGCDAEVACSVDSEGNREIDPEGDCNFVGDAAGGTRWESMNIVPLNARPWPWPE